MRDTKSDKQDDKGGEEEMKTQRLADFLMLIGFLLNFFLWFWSKNEFFYDNLDNNDFDYEVDDNQENEFFHFLLSYKRWGG